MIKIKIITVGKLKEGYLREACDEYVKRIMGHAQVEIVELRESKLPDSPSEGQIKNALTAEGENILAAVPREAYSIALCVEGKQLSSEELAAKMADVTNTSSCICFIIGSSYGLAPEVKSACDFRISFSKMTFPHQLMRVILLEQVYRGFMINGKRTYHK